MPTIDQIGAAGQALSTSDEILISQLVGGSRVTSKTTLGGLMTLLAAQGLLPSGFISGEGVPSNSIGSNGWTYLNASNGDVYGNTSGTWSKVGNIAGTAGATGPAGAAFQASSLPLVTSAAGASLVPISQSGTMESITLANLLVAETIDLLNPANPASDTDTFPTGQGSNVLTRQSLSAVWALMASHIPGWHRPVIEIKANTGLDGSIHNNGLLIVSQAVTITALGTMGSGFVCDIVNVSGGNITFGPGITTSNAGTTLPTGESARVMSAVYSGGTLVFAALSSGSGGTAPAAPGATTSLASAGVTSSTVSLTWTAPSTGGLVTSYTLNYRVHGAGSWTAAPGSPIAPATAATVTGLSASTSYDFQVIAANSGGAGTAAELDSVSTSAASAAPGAPTSVSAGGVTSSTATVAWSAPGSGGTVSGYSVYYGVHPASTWTLATSSLAVSATSYTVTGLAASTEYDFYVAANSAGNGSTASSTVNATTSASSGSYLLTDGTTPWTGGNPYTHGGAGSIAVNVDDNTQDGEGPHTLPANVQFALSTSNSVQPSTGLVSAAGYTTGIPGSSGRNLWYQWLTIPSTPGTYYLWSLALNGGGSVVASFHSTSTVTVT
jgi:hypothetical protein